MYIYPGTALFGLALGLHGYRKGSLNLSGATAAALIGYLTLACPVRTFGILLIVFYLVGSRATKVKADYKASLEEVNFTEKDSKRVKGGGNRNAIQVFCNGYLGCVAAVAWRLLYSGEWTTSFSSDKYVSDEWCALDEGGHSRPLVFLAVGFFAACLSDTLASELGILSSGPPYMITSFRIVPRGTNGAISLLGTVLSAVGGFFMGLTALVVLLLENSACRESTWRISIELLLYGTVAGTLGSLIDSILGATLQVSLYSEKSKRIVHSKHDAKDDDDKITVISGIDILSNDTVNLISSSTAAVLLALYTM